MTSSRYVGDAMTVRERNRAAWFSARLLDLLKTQVQRPMKRGVRSHEPSTKWCERRAERVVKCRARVVQVLALYSHHPLNEPPRKLRVTDAVIIFFVVVTFAPLEEPKGVVEKSVPQVW